jgi:hypothetical protein
MRVICDGRAYAETYTNLCFCVRKGYARRGRMKNGISRAVGSLKLLPCCFDKCNSQFVLNDEQIPFSFIRGVIRLCHLRIRHRGV